MRDPSGQGRLYPSGKEGLYPVILNRTSELNCQRKKGVDLKVRKQISKSLRSQDVT